MTGLVLLQGIIVGVLTGAIYALIALGFNLIFGIMRIVNFAHGHFVVLGMMLTVAFWKATGADPYLLLIVTAPAGFCIGALIYKIFVERILEAPEHSQFILTFGLLIMMENLILAIFGGKFEGVSTWYTSKSILLGGMITINYARLFGLVTALLSITALYVLFYKTGIGKVMRAVADDKDGAGLLGVNIPKVFAFAFALSVVFAVIAGASSISYMVTNPSAGTDLVIKSFVIVVFGGIGSIWGTIAGGLILGLIENLGALYITPSLASALALFILVILVIIKPTGLMGKK